MMLVSNGEVIVECMCVLDSPSFGRSSTIKVSGRMVCGWLDFAAVHYSHILYIIPRRPETNDPHMGEKNQKPSRVFNHLGRVAERRK
jgi:hypothetical protein